MFISLFTFIAILILLRYCNITREISIIKEIMRDISIFKERILQYIECKAITKYECYKNTGITNGVLSQKNGFSEENILRFFSYYKDLNPVWFITGEGDMLTDQTAEQKKMPPQNDTILSMLKTIQEQAEQIGKLKERLAVFEKREGHIKDAEDAGVAAVG